VGQFPPRVVMTGHNWYWVVLGGYNQFGVWSGTGTHRVILLILVLLVKCRIATYAIDDDCTISDCHSVYHSMPYAISRNLDILQSIA